MANLNKGAFSRLLGYSRPYWLQVGISLVASLLVAGSDVASAKLLQPLVDHVINARNVELIAFVPLIIIGLALIKGVARFVQEYFIKTAGQLMVQDIRNDLFGHTLSLSLGYFSKTSTGNLMSRILNDVGILQRSAADVLVNLLRESFTMFGLVALAFYTDWRLAITAFVVLPVCVFPATAIGRRIKLNTRKGQAQLETLTQILQEVFSGIKVIKAFGTEKAEDSRFRQDNRAFYHFIRKTLKYDSLSMPMVEIITSFGVAAVFWYGIQRVLSGGMSQGELFSFTAAMLMLYSPVKRLTNIANNVQKSVGAAERVFEVMDECPGVQDRTGAAVLPRVRGEVCYDKVTFAYDAETVLHEVSLTARPGEVVALVGPSGAGKSTLAGLLARFYDPTAGRVTIDGKDLRDVTLDSLRANLAMVDQEAVLFNATIRDNIRYGRDSATDDEVVAAARMAYADEFIDQMPEGYDTPIGDRGVRLSGGQRQRLCIARALLKNAPILILDEATSALDTESEAVVQQALANLMRNRTTIVIAHRLSTIMNADQIVVIEGGRVVETGRHQELLANNGLYQRLYAMQFRDE